MAIPKCTIYPLTMGLFSHFSASIDIIDASGFIIAAFLTSSLSLSSCHADNEVLLPLLFRDITYIRYFLLLLPSPWFQEPFGGLSSDRTWPRDQAVTRRTSINQVSLRQLFLPFLGAFTAIFQKQSGPGPSSQ